MSVPREYPPVKPVASLIYASAARAEEAKEQMAGCFGSIDWESGDMPFRWTDYYCEEMGSPLARCFVSFSMLIRRDALADLKLATNRIEVSLSLDGRRTVNIDPGFISAENIALATCKSAGHRVLLRDGVFADVQLLFHNGRLFAMPWTYPDYASAEVCRCLEQVRASYLKQLAGLRQERG